MRINQLSKTASLHKGDQLLVFGPSVPSFDSPAPEKTSLWGLIQYLAGGVFSYLRVEDWIKVPGVPFASLADPVEVGEGARATCTDARKDPDTIVTVGKTTGDQYGYSDDGYNQIGAITNDTFTPLGATIDTLVWDGVMGPPALLFVLTGAFADSGWTYIVVNGTSYNRADRAYYSTVLFPGYTVWAWEVGNPFGALGSQAAVYFDTPSTLDFYEEINGGGSTHTPVFSDGTVWRAGG